MKVPFLDLRVENDVHAGLLMSAIREVFKHGRFVMGPEVAELESRIADFCGRKYAVGVSSGTDALFFALKGLDIGVEDEVITTSLSWIATANAIALTGATPVFADIGDDLNIDPKSIQRLITSRTKAILPVHYTGKVCRMDAIQEIADKYGVFVVEDAAQAFGASYDGRVAGSFGAVASFSMNPMKVFAACGEAGMVLTDSKEVYDKLFSLRYNGTVNKEKCIFPSFNGRIDTLQAAILLRRFDTLQTVIERRKEIAACYNELLKGIVKLPMELEKEKDVYYTYTIQTSERDELKAFLENKGVETKIQHPYLMPQQPAYKDNVRGEFLNAEKIVKQILCIPVHEKLTGEEIRYVVQCVKEFFEKEE